MHESDRPGIHPTVYRQPGGNVPTEATAVRDMHVDRVEGQTIVVEGSRIAQLTGQRVSLERSTAQRVEGRSVQADRSAIRHLEAERAVALRSAVALARVRELRAARARIGLLRADRVEVEHGTVGIALVRELAGPTFLRVSLGSLLAFAGGIVTGIAFSFVARSKRR
ncbi:hypothetical protein OO015_04050 [Thermomicrobium sp. 4228-Ro]|uniref:hypothetical protein n=1 Tax=Thermomicrobium sp. 4228-Ro TaxID=2993937 RepID=UPI0022493544|nr:hypothetical protein [Thermomicrobium sp. 4228-Ro]MCX2726664.1 hypothetical protein [Thermomicrobium sp. 4228-Ro]